MIASLNSRNSVPVIRSQLAVRGLGSPVKAYKHISTRFADDFASGRSIQVGTHAAYRVGEHDRVDPLEGVAQNHFVDHIVGRTGSSPEMSDQFGRATNLYFPPGSNVRLRNVTTTVFVPQAYLFCASTEPDWSRLEKGEAIFEITDLALFAHRLRMGRPDLLFDTEIGLVNYVDRNNPSSAKALSTPDPFEKDERFRNEREVRIVWWSPPGGNQYELIRAPRAARLIREAIR